MPRQGCLVDRVMLHHISTLTDNLATGSNTAVKGFGNESRRTTELDDIRSEEEDHISIVHPVGNNVPIHELQVQSDAAVLTLGA